MKPLNIFYIESPEYPAAGDKATIFLLHVNAHGIGHRQSYSVEADLAESELIHQKHQSVVQGCGYAVVDSIITAEFLYGAAMHYSTLPEGA